MSLLKSSSKPRVVICLIQSDKCYSDSYTQLSPFWLSPIYKPKKNTALNPFDICHLRFDGFVWNELICRYSCPLTYLPPSRRANSVERILNLYLMSKFRKLAASSIDPFIKEQINSPVVGRRSPHSWVDWESQSEMRSDVTISEINFEWWNAG